MRLISLAGSLLLGLSLTTGSMAAAVPAGSATVSLSAAKQAAASVVVKPAKSKSRRRHAGPTKASLSTARKPTPRRAGEELSLADRSIDGHLIPAPERVYDGPLPGAGYSVAFPSFANRQGRTECVELIKGLLGAPSTTLWKEGRKLRPHADEIEPGTAIATFVDGRYPNSRRRGNKHAAIFLRATEGGIYVLDQFAHQAAVKERFIPWQHPRDRRAANNASSYSTVRW